MTGDISVRKAIMLYLKGWSLKNQGKKLLAKMQTEKARDASRIELYHKGKRLINEGNKYENIAKTAFKKTLFN